MRLNTVYSVHNGPNGGVTLRWLWAQIRKIAAAGESWFVVSLVGTLVVIQSCVREADEAMGYG